MKSIAVIGLGNIAERHRRNLKELYPTATIYAMSASGRLPNENIDIHEVIQVKPHMAVVASPSSKHAEHSVHLLNEGIPCLIEKPVASNSELSNSIFKASKNNNTKVAVAYCLRYLSSAIELKSILASNILGEIINVSCEVGQYLPDWRPNKDYRHSVSSSKKLGGGVLLELSHELDYVNWLFGIESLEYSVVRENNSLDMDVEAIADVVLKLKDNTYCNVHLDCLQRYPTRNCNIIGTKARLDWDIINNKIFLGTTGGSKIIYDGSQWDRNLMYINMVKDFVANINGHDHNCIKIEDALSTVNLIDQIKEHARQGWT
jgi:predicted dehydrogenase